MRQIPYAHILLVEDFVFLVVTDHVVLDEAVVDHSGLDSLGVFLNLTLRLQLIPNVRLHF